MLKLFEYNWQVRQDCLVCCKEVSEEELFRRRTGGFEGIWNRLFNIADVEFSWVSGLQGKPEFTEPFESYASLQKVTDLSARFHVEVRPFVTSWTNGMELNELSEFTPKGEPINFKYGEVMRHVIAH